MYSQVPFSRGGPNKRGRAHIPLPLTRGRAHEKFEIIKRGRVLIRGVGRTYPYP